MGEKSTQHILITSESTLDRSAAIAYLAKSLSEAGTGCFAADCSGTLSSLARDGLPVTFWDIDAAKGLPLRTTVSELGDVLLSRMLSLTDAQADLLSVYFKIADENDLLLIDTKDLRALINHVKENSSDFEETYGKINSKVSSAILNAIAALEAKGGAGFLFEPAIDVKDFTGISSDGAGRINIFEAADRIEDEEIYSCFMLYILSELAENMPESGHTVFAVIVDEVGLLFKKSSRSFTNRVVRLLSRLQEKGIEAVFACEKEGDIPEEIRGKLKVRITAEGGAAAVTVTDTDASSVGLPSEISLEAVKKSLEALDEDLRSDLIAEDALSEKYKIPFDRDSAYEFLQRRGIGQEESLADSESGSQEISTPGETVDESNVSQGTSASEETAEETSAKEDEVLDGKASDESENPSKLNTQDIAKRAKSSAKSLGNTVAGTVGRQVGKTIGSSFGSFGETLGGNIGASLGRGIMNTFFSGD